MASRVSAKLEEGDFKGTVRLACSEESVAEENEVTLSALRSKHPDAHPDTVLPPPPLIDDLEEEVLVVCETDVARAIQSFPKGSAGGPDGHSLGI